jgi:hypothetical protein
MVDGVVHVYRRDLVHDPHNFLNLKVPEFFDARQEPAGLTNQRLLRVMQNMISPHGVPPGSGEGGSYSAGNVHETQLRLNLRGLTTRQALESLTRSSEHEIWVVTFVDTGNLTQKGFFRTATLWHHASFPDSQQPMWDFLAWSEYARISH